MAAPPLTHHEILALVQPFARRGRHVDLASSQRADGLHGPTGHRPRAPVLWAVTEAHANAVQAFGRKLVLQ